MSDTIDELSEMNIKFKLAMQKKNKITADDKYLQKKTLINGTKVNIKEIDRFRQEMKLSKLVHKIRQCLGCFAKFHSQGAHNRMCRKCVDAS